MTVTGLFDLNHYRCDAEYTTVQLPGHEERSVSRVSEVRNPRYHFDVRADGAGGYALTSFRPIAEGATESISFCCCPFADTSKGRTYLDIARDPDTTALSTRDMTWQGRPAVEFRFESSYRDRKDGTMKRARSAYLFDPAGRWVCVGERSIPREPSQDSTSYEWVYGYDTAGEWPVPTRQEIWKVDERRPEARTRTSLYEIDEYQPLPGVDEAEFTLTAFGLPEPVGMEPEEKPGRRYVWFLAAAAAFGLLTVGFRYLARRRAARPPGAPVPT
jgi:hypothetical protein